MISITSFKEIPLDILNKKHISKSPSCNIRYGRMEENDQEYDDFETDSVSYQEDNRKSSDKISILPRNNEPVSESKTERINGYFNSIIKMPNSLRWLCVTHGFCWMSLLCYSLYFTDFVGEEIYGILFFISLS